MRNNKKIVTRLLAILTAAGLTIGLAGCKHNCPECPHADDDIIYSWKIPTSEADCDSIDPDLEYRDEATADDGSLDGGASIVDRDGGAALTGGFEDVVKAPELLSRHGPLGAHADGLPSRRGSGE